MTISWNPWYSIESIHEEFDLLSLATRSWRIGLAGTVRLKFLGLSASANKLGTPLGHQEIHRLYGSPWRNVGMRTVSLSAAYSIGMKSLAFRLRCHSSAVRRADDLPQTVNKSLGSFKHIPATASGFNARSFSTLRMCRGEKAVVSTILEICLGRRSKGCVSNVALRSPNLWPNFNVQVGTWEKTHSPISNCGEEF